MFILSAYTPNYPRTNSVYTQKAPTWVLSCLDYIVILPQ